jgi:hypothetical protein
MQLGKKLGTGFVSDDAQATTGEEVVLSSDGADAEAPEASALPEPEPEPTTAS